MSGTGVWGSRIIELKCLLGFKRLFINDCIPPTLGLPPVCIAGPLLNKVLFCPGSTSPCFSTSLLRQKLVGLPEPHCEEGCLIGMFCHFEVINS